MIKIYKIHNNNVKHYLHYSNIQKHNHKHFYNIYFQYINVNQAMITRQQW